MNERWLKAHGADAFAAARCAWGAGGSAARQRRWAGGGGENILD